MKQRLLISLVAVLCCIGAWGQTDGPANNEIWYTSTDGNPIEFNFENIGTPKTNEKPVGKDYYVATFNCEEIKSLEKYGSITVEEGFYPTLKTITVPACLESLGDVKTEDEYEAYPLFGYSKNFESIIFPEDSKLKCIRPRCFEESGLKSICIPKGVKEILNDAFNSCESLETVTFAPGSQLEYIGERAFYCTYSITSAIVIPASVKTIGNSAFDYCWAPSITFAPGSQLETIGGGAFCGIMSTSFTIPASVKTIGSNAFYDSDIATVIFEGTPETIAADAFEEVKAILYYEDPNLAPIYSMYSLQLWGEEKTAEELTEDENAAIIEAAEADGWNYWPYDEQWGDPACFIKDVLPTLVLPTNWAGNEYVDEETEWYGGFFALAANAQEVTEVGWTSMYLDYKYTLPMGAVAFYASKSEGSKITLVPIKGVIPANTGVVIKAEKNCVLTAIKTDEDPTTTITGNLLRGVTVDTPVTEEVYVLSPATTESCPVFQNYTGTTLGANKAYILKSDVTAGDVLNFEFAGAATAIDHVSVQPGKTSSVRYNLNGQAVGADYKGIVIVNGKKMLNK